MMKILSEIKECFIVGFLLFAYVFGFAFVVSLPVTLLYVAASLP